MSARLADDAPGRRGRGARDPGRAGDDVPGRPGARAGETPAAHQPGQTGSCGALLTPDDVVLLHLLSEGLPLRAVANRLRVSERTVRRRVRSVLQQLGVTSSVEAVVWAVRHGLV